MRKNWRRIWVQHIPWTSKTLFCFWIEAYCLFVLIFWNGHIRNVVSTLPNVVKINVENGNVVSTLSNVVQFNIEIHNVLSTLLNVVDFNVDVRNVVSTLIWRCATSRRHINLKATLNRRWNVCWDKMEVFETIFMLLPHPRNSFLYHLYTIFITYKNV